MDPISSHPPSPSWKHALPGHLGLDTGKPAPAIGSPSKENTTENAFKIREKTSHTPLGKLAKILSSGLGLSLYGTAQGFAGLLLGTAFVPIFMGMAIVGVTTAVGCALGLTFGTMMLHPFAGVKVGAGVGFIVLGGLGVMVALPAIVGIWTQVVIIPARAITTTMGSMGAKLIANSQGSDKQDINDRHQKLIDRFDKALFNRAEAIIEQGKKKFSPKFWNL